MKKIIVHSVLFILLLAACNTTADSKSVNLPQLTDAWSIAMTHSGGIAGVSYFIEVIANGKYTVRDDRSGATFTGQLSPAELEKLTRLVNSTEFSQSLEPHGCADCFIYDIQITSKGEKFSAQVDDITIEKSGLEPLIGALRNIIEREVQ